MTLVKFINNFLEPFAYFIYLVAVGIRFIYDRRLPLRVSLILYVCATVLMTIACIHIYTDSANLWAYNTLLLLALPSLGFYFYCTLTGKPKKRTALIILLSALVYYFINNVVFKQFNQLDSIGLVFLSILVSVCSFMYFQQILHNVKEEPIFSDFNFWLISSYLIYYLGSFFIFLCYNYFTASIMKEYRDEDRLILSMLWGVHNISLFLGAVIALTGSIWTTYRNRLR